MGGLGGRRVLNLATGGVATFSKGSGLLNIHQSIRSTWRIDADKVASLANRTQSEVSFNGTTVPELGSTVDKAYQTKTPAGATNAHGAYSVKNRVLARRLDSVRSTR